MAEEKEKDKEKLEPSALVFIGFLIGCFFVILSTMLTKSNNEDLLRNSRMDYMSYSQEEKMDVIRAYQAELKFDAFNKLVERCLEDDNNIDLYEFDYIMAYVYYFRHWTGRHP